jgi:CRISPR/Cas system-associated protein Cas10 (large subunit of type III CRISPR-Cas system)
MSEDFHITPTSASRWEGNVHYYMAPPVEQVKALLPMLYSLIQSQTDPSGDHTCPICGQTFEIDFSRVEISVDPMTISTFCKTCNIHLFFQSNKIPSWAKSWTDRPGVKEFLEELHKHGENDG